MHDTDTAVLRAAGVNVTMTSPAACDVVMDLAVQSADEVDHRLDAARFELREVAAGLVDRALLEQRLALARDRGEVVGVALERLAVVVDRLALQPLRARGLGEVEVDRQPSRQG